jgi:hypothetical protein
MEQFGAAKLGDSRRVDRLVRVAAGASENPSGKVSEVFSSSCELDGAYDFLENDHVSACSIALAMMEATARRCIHQEFVWVAVDGSSLNLTDHARVKGFGSVGTIDAGASGLKVISALAIGRDGATVGLLAQTWWARQAGPKRSAKEKRKSRRARPDKEKETRYWLEAIDDARQRLDETGAHGWFQLDREADARPILLGLQASGHRFTVRSAWDRVVDGGQFLRATLERQLPVAAYDLDVPGRATREARHARMIARHAPTKLRLRDRRTNKTTWLAVHAVWVREEGTTPEGEKPLDWLLFTNAQVQSVDDVYLVVEGYARRWRIEDFHRTWKSGACNVEQMQLRSREAAVRWATLLAAVATRVERLKHLARNQPAQLATLELSTDELRVLIALKRRNKKRTESIPRAAPTIAQAVQWIAELGGYTGKSSGGPPGSITIARGLERLRYAVDGARATATQDVDEI